MRSEIWWPTGKSSHSQQEADCRGYSSSVTCGKCGTVTFTGSCINKPTSDWTQVLEYDSPPSPVPVKPPHGDLQLSSLRQCWWSAQPSPLSTLHFLSCSRNAGRGTSERGALVMGSTWHWADEKCTQRRISHGHNHNTSQHPKPTLDQLSRYSSFRAWKNTQCSFLNLETENNESFNHVFPDKVLWRNGN